MQKRIAAQPTVESYEPRIVEVNGTLYEVVFGTGTGATSTVYQAKVLDEGHQVNGDQYLESVSDLGHIGAGQTWGRPISGEDTESPLVAIKIARPGCASDMVEQAKRLRKTFSHNLWKDPKHGVVVVGIREDLSGEIPPVIIVDWVEGEKLSKARPMLSSTTARFGMYLARFVFRAIRHETIALSDAVKPDSLMLQNPEGGDPYLVCTDLGPVSTDSPTRRNIEGYTIPLLASTLYRMMTGSILRLNTEYGSRMYVGEPEKIGVGACTTHWAASDLWMVRLVSRLALGKYGGRIGQEASHGKKLVQELYDDLRERIGIQRLTVGNDAYSQGFAEAEASDNPESLLRVYDMTRVNQGAIPDEIQDRYTTELRKLIKDDIGRGDTDLALATLRWLMPRYSDDEFFRVMHHICLADTLIGRYGEGDTENLRGVLASVARAYSENFNETTGGVDIETLSRISAQMEGALSEMPTLSQKESLAASALGALSDEISIKIGISIMRELGPRKKHIKVEELRKKLDDLRSRYTIMENAYPGNIDFLQIMSKELELSPLSDIEQIQARIEAGQKVPIAEIVRLCLKGAKRKGLGDITVFQVNGELASAVLHYLQRDQQGDVQTAAMPYKIDWEGNLYAVASKYTPEPRTSLVEQ